MTEEDDETSLAVPLLFVGADETPILHANQFVIQFYPPDGFTLTIGQVSPPMLIGAEAERIEQAKRISYVPVKVVGRYAIPPARLRELVSVLTDNLQKYESTQKDNTDDARADV